jgi:hypothetical protein
MEALLLWYFPFAVMCARDPIVRRVVGEAAVFCAYRMARALRTISRAGGSLAIRKASRAIRMLRTSHGIPTRTDGEWLVLG